MPRRNRVTPFGTLDATPARGAFMGNRGDLHGRDGTIVRDARPGLVRWICCRLDVGAGGPVPFDRPGRYTPLFFADEAVALAAGHRPCAACRREAWTRFTAAWRHARGLDAAAPVRAATVDRILDAARPPKRRGERERAALADLPDGVFVLRDDAPAVPRLRWAGALHSWSHAGYGPAETPARQEIVAVLTPSPLVAVLRAGFRPEVPAFAGRTTGGRDADEVRPCFDPVDAALRK